MATSDPQLKVAVTGLTGADVFVFNDATETLNDTSADGCNGIRSGDRSDQLSGVTTGLSFICNIGFSGTDAVARIRDGENGCSECC